MTNKISKVWGDISYTIDEEQEVDEHGESRKSGAPRKEKKKEDTDMENESAILPTRLRDQYKYEKTDD